MPTTPSPHPQLDALIRQDPDLVDRTFDYLLAELPELSPERARLIAQQVRRVHGGQENYIRKDAAAAVTAEVLRQLNGRNATEVARRPGVSRATVYRCIKQAGGHQR